MLTTLTYTLYFIVLLTRDRLNFVLGFVFSTETGVFTSFVFVSETTATIRFWFFPKLTLVWFSIMVRKVRLKTPPAQCPCDPCKLCNYGTPPKRPIYSTAAAMQCTNINYLLHCELYKDLFKLTVDGMAESV